MVSSAEEGSFSAEPFLVKPCLVELYLAKLCHATAATIQECYLDDSLFEHNSNELPMVKDLSENHKIVMILLILPKHKISCHHMFN